MSGERTLDDLREQIFSIPVITDIVFDQLALLDIFSCSVASKTLFSMTRDYIRRRRTLLLKCTDEISELEKCVRFWGENSNETILPKIPIQFHGTHFVINDNLDFDEEETDKYKKTKSKALVEKLLKQITMKHLVVTFPKLAIRPIHEFMRWGILFPLLQLLGDETETVTVNGMEDNIRWLKRLHGGFKNLKSVETDSFQSNFKIHDMDLKLAHNFENLLVNCPALQELKIPVNMLFLTPFVTHGKLPLISSLVMPPFDTHMYGYNAEFLEKLAKSGASFQMLSVYMNFDVGDSRYKKLEDLLQLFQPCLNSVRKVYIRFICCDAILDVSLPCLPRVEEVCYGKLNMIYLEPEDYDHVPIENRFKQSYPRARITREFK